MECIMHARNIHRRGAVAAVNDSIGPSRGAADDRLILLTIILAMVGILIIGATGALMQSGRRQASAHSEVKPATVEAAPRPEQVSSRLLFTGDVFWGRQTEIWAEQSELGTKLPFAGLHTFDREEYDAWIGTLECPVTSTPLSLETQRTDLRFNCMPEYVPEAAKWFTAFNLASNHTADMQYVDGFAQTRRHLEKNDIQHFGHFDAAVTSDTCEVVGIPARIRLDDSSTQEGEQYMPIALCGFNNVYRLPTDQELAVVKEYARWLPTFVTPQQGAEYLPAADGYKERTFRTLIDHGADAVIGGQPHWVQNTEVYKGKLIAYSVGNFMFDQRWSEEVMKGAAIAATLEVPYTPAVERWLELGEKCRKSDDRCLATVRQYGLAKPELDLRYEIIPVDARGQYSVRGDHSLHEFMQERTGWQRTSQSLSDVR